MKRICLVLLILILQQEGQMDLSWVVIHFTDF